MTAKNNMPLPDPHFGSEEVMLAWCEAEGLTPVKDEDGEWDWHAVWEIYEARLDAEEEEP